MAYVACMCVHTGVLREWLTEVAGSLFDPSLGLFRLCEGDQRALHISAAGWHQLELMRFAGRIIGGRAGGLVRDEGD